MKKSIGRLLGVAGALAMVCNLAWADTAPVQASLSLTNLNYTLTDLDTTDGVMPSLTPSTSSVFSVYAVPNTGDYANSVSSGLLPGDHFDGSSSSVSLPDGQGSATKQGNSQLTDASLTSTVLLQGAPVNVYTQVKTYADFTLSAHSKLVISGDLVLTTQIDGAAISALIANSDGTLTVTSEARFAPYIASAQLTSNAMSAYMDAQYWYWKAGATQSFTALGAGVLSNYNDVPGGKIQLEITNSSDVDASFQLNSIAYAQASMAITAVPEPASWALMGLGLLGVAATGKRRRQAV